MMKKAKWLVKEAGLRVNYMARKNCIFCKIVKGEIKSELLIDNSKVVAFNDINPVARVHILIVPKKHIESVSTITENDGEDIAALFNAACDLAKEKNLDAYRLSFNAGRFQHIGHLHMHLLAGSEIQWSKL